MTVIDKRVAVSCLLRISNHYHDSAPHVTRYCDDLVERVTCGHTVASGVEVLTALKLHKPYGWRSPDRAVRLVTEIMEMFNRKDGPPRAKRTVTEIVDEFDRPENHAPNKGEAICSLAHSADRFDESAPCVARYCDNLIVRLILWPGGVASAELAGAMQLILIEETYLAVRSVRRLQDEFGNHSIMEGVMK